MSDTKAKYCIVLGAGGHAGVLIDAIQSGNIARVHGILEPDTSRWGKDLLGVPILGADDLLTELVDEGITHFVIGLGSTGNNRPRQRLYQLGCSHELKPLTIIHPGAFCSEHASVGAGAQLLVGSIIQTRAVLGRNVIINSGAVVEHDCVIGDHAHIATGAVLASTVNVGELAHIGAGATVRQRVSIGKEAVVGAGAAVVQDIPDNVVAAGVPARIMQKKSR